MLIIVTVTVAILLLAGLAIFVIHYYIKSTTITVSVYASASALLGDVNSLKYSHVLASSQNTLVTDVSIIISEHKEIIQDNITFTKPLSNFSGLNAVYALAGSHFNFYFSNISGPSEKGFQVFVTPQGATEAVCTKRFTAELKTSSFFCTVNNDGSYNIEIVVDTDVTGMITYNLSLLVLNNTYYQKLNGSKCTLSPTVSNCSLKVASTGLAAHNEYIIALIDPLASVVSLRLEYVGRKELYFCSVLSVPLAIILVVVVMLLTRSIHHCHKHCSLKSYKHLI